MTNIFLDTVGLLALWDETDQWHEVASASLVSLNVPGTRLLTTSLVLLECGNAASRKPYRRDVCLLRDRLQRENYLIIPTEPEIEQAWTAYRNGDASSPGVVDQVSFIVMRRLAISAAFTNDRHFKAAGFVTLF